jgi:hypothetical protein
MKGATVPNIQSSDQAANLQQSYTSTAISNLGSSPIVDGSILPSIALKSGSNSVSHKLGRKLNGWLIVRQRAAATVYDNQDNNQTPAQTLTLQASADVTVDLYVF